MARRVDIEGMQTNAPAHSGPASVPATPRALMLAKAALAFCLFTFAMGQTILFALLGPTARDLGLAEWQVGTVVSAAATGMLFFSPIWGRFADRKGRKPVLVAGMIGYAVATTAFALCLQVGLSGMAQGLGLMALLIGARVMFALLVSGVHPAAIAFTADITTGRDRSAGMSFVGAAFGVGSIAGPVFAAVLAIYGVLTPLFAAAGLALFAALAAAFVLPPAPPSKMPEGAARTSFSTFLPFLLTAFGIFAVMASVQQTAAFYMQDELALDTKDAIQAVGIMLSIMSAAALLMQVGFTQRYKPTPKTMLSIGLPLVAVGVFGILIAQSFVHYSIAFAAFGLGIGLSNPGVMAATSLAAEPHEQGATAGMLNSAIACGFIVGPLGGTLLYTAAHWLPYAVGSVVIAGLAVMVLTRIRFRDPAEV